MALFRCGTSGGGGSLTPTTLWENSNTSLAFPRTGVSNEVSLSDNINNYTYIKFKFNRSTSDSVNNCEVIYTVDEFKKFTTAASKFSGAVAFISTSGTSPVFARRMYYVSDTTINITNMAQINGTVSDQNAGIPVAIYGLK